jgi:acetyl-CoA C-acetyltransferase
VPVEVPALMTQRICGTGFELFRQAGEQIESGCADVAWWSRAPSHDAQPDRRLHHRTGFKLGAPVGFKDFMWEALNDPAAGIT